MTLNTKVQRRKRRHTKVRAKTASRVGRPRLAVFRSNKYIYAQLIDDAKAVTLAQASDTDKKFAKEKKMAKQERAREVGKLLAERAKKKDVTDVSFDRGGFLYRGRVKALAEGAREGGLVF